MERESSIGIIRGIAERVVAETELELVHVEIGLTSGKRTVRIYIDRENGVTHDDCALVSHEVERLLDLEDPISGNYVLEVSSPGIERGLYSLGDFEKFTGKIARVKTHRAIGGQRNFKGMIKGVSGDSVVIDDLTKGDKSIEFDLIRKANLVFDAEKELRKSRNK